jgi:glycosyltransferase involved in cell wall biosynthesis
MIKGDVLVSVVVPTLNNEPTLELCLKSIRSQTYKNVEIIVVDNGSTDRTLEIANKYSDLVFFSKSERSKQRNLGFNEAKGEIFLYLDSDMMLSRNAIQESLKIFAIHQEIVALYLPEMVEGLNLLSRILNFERSFYNQTVIDAVRFVRRETFLKIHGFDENLVSAEDWDLDRRIRDVGFVSSIESPLYHWQYEVTFRKYLLKKKYYSKLIDKYIEKWGKNDFEIKKQFGFYYRFIGVFIENDKWRVLISQPKYSIPMYVLKFVVGLIYILNINE